MNVALRVFLLAGALAVLALILRKLKRAEIQTIDTVFWFLFFRQFCSFAAFPQIAYWFSGLLGFEAPSNFVFLYAIAVLIMREFSMTVKVARMRLRLNSLIQEMALSEKEQKN